MITKTASKKKQALGKIMFLPVTDATNVEGAIVEPEVQKYSNAYFQKYIFFF
jgi:hypothetical protein